MNDFRAVIKKKFTLDFLFNGISFIFLSVYAIIINTLIGKYYNINNLGVYHTVFAIYMIISVLFSLGISNSLLKYTSERTSETDKLNNIIVSGLTIITISSILLSSLLYSLLITETIHMSNELLKPFSVLLCALPLFCINKGFRAIFNGLRWMRIYALIDLMRWTIIVIILFYCIFNENEFYNFFYSFILAEVLILLLSITVLNHFICIKFRTEFKCFKKHLRFGLTTLTGNTILIGNNKLDILLLSALTSNNALVGIYSFASEIAKGMLNLSNIIQVNFNPVISKLCYEKELDALKIYINKISKYVIVMIIPLIILASILYPVYILLFLDYEKFVDSLSVFYILMAGTSVGSLYFWCGSILPMSGFPQDSIKRNILLLFFTIILTTILINSYGVNGAAIATSCSFVFRVLTLEYYVNKRLNFTITPIIFKLDR